MATGGAGERNCVTVLWRIENISYHDGRFHFRSIDSPSYHIRNLSDNYGLTYITLYPKGESEGDERLCITFITCSNIDSPVDIEFSLLARDGSPLISRTLTDQRLWDDIHMPDCPTHAEVFGAKKTIFLPRDTLTVRCRIWKSNGNFLQPEFISACSRVISSEYCVSWPISKPYELKEVQNLNAPVAFDFLDEFIDFDFNCSLIDDSLQNCEIKTRAKITRSLFLKIAISILGDRQEEIILLEDEHKFQTLKTKETWAVPNFLLNEKLSKKMPSFKLDKYFNILFRFTVVRCGIIGFVEKTCIGKSSLECKVIENMPTCLEASCQTDSKICNIPENLQWKCDSVCALMEDFQSLYCEQNFTDFKLRSGDVSFPVHKSVLSARSPVFKAMFFRDMKESDADSLDIPDLDSHTLNRMLTFLYTGTLEPDLEWERAAKLYCAATTYKVQSLKQPCFSILKSGITVSNVSDILTLGDLHQDQDLTSVAHDFVLSRFDETVLSEEWKKFMRTDAYLAGNTMQLLYEKKLQLKK